MKRSTLITLGALLSALACGATAGPRDIAASHDLSMAASAEHLLVQWRPLAPDAPAVLRVEVSHNGRVLERLEGAVLQGVAPRQMAGLYLVDVSDGAVSEALRRAVSQHAEIAVSHSASRMALALMLFDDQAVLWQAAPAPLADVITDIRTVSSTAGTPNLWGGLVQGLGYLGTLPVERRALFLVSDGRSAPESGQHDAALVQTALASGVQIEPIVCPSGDTTRQGLLRLRQLADASGGQVLLLPPGTCQAPLSEMVAHVERIAGGGSAASPVGQLLHMPWERHSVLNADFTFADGSRHQLSLPHATPQAALREVPLRQGIVPAVALAVLAAGLAAWWAATRRRRRKPAAHASGE